ncbi:PAS domain S-box protein [Pseudalkalibacillus hwajinpoensis]|uniref:PAS domain S-box protein n=1 Tax=Guptibacillus hwajinpoensis TaxID=208199 RepID=UPI00325C0122
MKERSDNDNTVRVFKNMQWEGKMVNYSDSILIEKNQLTKLHRDFEKFQSLFTHFPDIMYSLNLSGFITDVNEYGKKYFLTEHISNIINQHYTAFIITSEQDRVSKSFRLTIEGHVTQLQTTFVNRSGEQFEVELINIPFFIEDEVKGIYSLVRDLSKEHGTVLALRESEGKYRLIAEHTSELITLVNVERDVVTYASPSHRTILGHFPSYYTGSSIQKDVHPEDQRAAHLLYNRTDNSYPAVVEYRRKHANCTWITLEDRAKLIPYGINGERMIVVVSRDITEKKHAEKELQQTIKQLKDLKYALDESALVSVTDMEGIITSVNEKFCEITGYEKNDLIGEDHIILNSGYHPPSFFDEMWSVIRSGSVWKGEINNFTKQGDTFWVDTTVVPFLDDKGVPYQYVYIRNDITDRKRAEELLRTSDKLSVIGELAAGVAHEIRNPLTSLKGFTQILKSRHTCDSDQEFIKIMLAELDRINMIVNEFMVLARPQAVNFEQTNIHYLITNVLTLIETQAILNNVQIYTRVIDNLPEISCSENQIKQVLINVIKNAIEAMPEGGEVVLSVYIRHGELMIEIRDNGSGIPEHELAHLGEPFYTTKEKGNGLGLMICRRIVQNHKGEFLIDSREEEGTVVTIRLPIE